MQAQTFGFVAQFATDQLLDTSRRPFRVEGRHASNQQNVAPAAPGGAERGDGVWSYVMFFYGNEFDIRFFREHLTQHVRRITVLVAFADAAHNHMATVIIMVGDRERLNPAQRNRYLAGKGKPKARPDIQFQSHGGVNDSQKWCMPCETSSNGSIVVWGASEPERVSDLATGKSAPAANA
jgi:hypothetical protein